MNDLEYRHACIQTALNIEMANAQMRGPAEGPIDPKTQQPRQIMPQIATEHVIERANALLAGVKPVHDRSTRD